MQFDHTTKLLPAISVKAAHSFDHTVVPDAAQFRIMDDGVSASFFGTSRMKQSVQNIQ